MTSYIATFKICIFGDSGVGKTSLTHRYISNRFEEDTKMTIGVDILSKDVEIENFIVKLQIWDFAGEERFRFLLRGRLSAAVQGLAHPLHFALLDHPQQLGLDAGVQVADFIQTVPSASVMLAPT
jgi:small GTP-binding protein